MGRFGITELVTIVFIIFLIGFFVGKGIGYKKGINDGLKKD